MKAPVSLFTPYVEPVRIRKERVENYEATLYGQLPFVLHGSVAHAQAEGRSKEFAKRVVNQALQRSETDEPVTAKRRIR